MGGVLHPMKHMLQLAVPSTLSKTYSTSHCWCDVYALLVLPLLQEVYTALRVRVYNVQQHEPHASVLVHVDV